MSFMVQHLQILNTCKKEKCNVEIIHDDLCGSEPTHYVGPLPYSVEQCKAYVAKAYYDDQNYKMENGRVLKHVTYSCEMLTVPPTLVQVEPLTSPHVE